jgi:hypothetical protein
MAQIKHLAQKDIKYGKFKQIFKLCVIAGYCSILENKDVSILLLEYIENTIFCQNDLINVE